MSRLQNLFRQKTSNVLNVYCTAGYPELNSTLEVLQILQSEGADLIELGMPYSDPLADGPVIQNSSMKALQNGMSIAFLFEQLSDFRKTIHVPVVLMGYMNPVLQYGFEKFCKEASEKGIDAIILPDLPPHEYETFYGPIIQRYGLEFIFLVTPESSDERVRWLDRLSSGFLYAVSSSSITGTASNKLSVQGYLQRLQSLKLNNPILVGFGIRDRAAFQEVCAYANGGIIGSAYIQALEKEGSIQENTKLFLENIRL
jgi:tryptophan synthase alpha chain